MKAIWRTALGLLLALARTGSASAETFRWLQYTADGLEARAVTEAAACPAATIDGAERPMQVRVEPDAAFPIRVCALTVPSGAQAVTVDGATLKLPPARPRRIAVIGDTGCRLKVIVLQACNDPEKWPFATIAAAVARAAPDLVIHVGDYNYRETPCPFIIEGCKGSPYGDNWDAWRIDFFAPAAPLLAAAPWVVVRGNHEMCSRTGRGFSRALDAYAFDAAKGCNDTDPPYVVRLDGLALAVLDVGPASDVVANATEAEAYRRQYEALAQTTSGPAWIVQHRPIWSAAGRLGGLPLGANRTLALATAGVIPANVSMVVAGHHHIFDVMAFREDLPVEVVAGHGGDWLNPGKPADPAGWMTGGATVKGGTLAPGYFGYAMIELDGEKRAVVTSYDRDAHPRQRCVVTGRQARCGNGERGSE
jgi:hypothetical protein